jgi:integrase
MKDKKELTVRDFNKFKSALDKTGSSQYIDFFTFMFNTGLRTSEVLELKFTDINYKSNSITVSKGRQNFNPSLVVLNDECMQVIHRLKDKYPNDVFVFQSRNSMNQKNKPPSSITRQVVTKAFKTASDITSLPITPNTLRNYYANQSFSLNFLSKSDPEIKSRLLGHLPINMTNQYVNYNCTNKNDETFNCLSAPSFDMSNSESDFIEYLLNGGALNENYNFDDICQKYGISENDLTITLKTIKVLRNRQLNSEILHLDNAK